MSAIPRSAHFRWTFVALSLFCGFVWLEGSASAAPPKAVHRLQRTLSGAATFNYFGHSAANAGDVNGDGYDDQIVGAPGGGSLGTDAGRAHVFFGGPGADAVADLTLTGQVAGDQFGATVSSAGDFNADGYSDVIVGAPNNDAVGSNSGRAYIYFGGSAPNAVADHTITGANAEDQYGASVSTAGDVNGDGFSDVIVGAPFVSGVGLAEGRAYVYYGGPVSDANPDLILAGSGFTALGMVVSTAGDVNADGFSDLLVAAPQKLNGGFAGPGEVYLYYGGKFGDTAVDLTLVGEANSDVFGSAISTAGDVNGDGYDDILVGAPQHDGVTTYDGKGYLYYGGPGMDNVADQTFLGDADASFGVSVSAAGDVNRDGFSDIVIGAYGASGGGQYAGRAHLFYGGPSVDAVADRTFTGASGFENLGSSVSSAGDQNSDGYADFIIGASGVDGSGQDVGAVYLYDSKRYVVLSPAAGDTWNVGATKTISWMGAEPADLWLTTDGGSSYTLLESNVGGSDENLFTLRVPHSPTKFARIRLTPSDANVAGDGKSDSTFTIQTSVALLALLAAPLPQGGASITWQSDPGPDDLAGYRLDRSRGSEPWSTVAALTRETSHTDPTGGPGSRYRLFAVNGFGEALLLGETSIRPLKPLTAGPLPYRGGRLTISFATAAGLGGTPALTDVSLFDVSGRLVRQVAHAPYSPGYQTTVWDGKDQAGRDVSSGVYFLRLSSANEKRVMRVTILR